MLPTPFYCREMAREGCELIDEVLQGVEGELPHYFVDQDSFHPPSHHFCDGVHGCRYRRHVCAVHSLNGIS